MAAESEGAAQNSDLRPFKFTNEHDILLAREILVNEPYKFKPRSKESGQKWDKIAQNLNAIKTPHFRVTGRSVRDRAKRLTQNYAFKMREEEKASGIDVPEPSELDIALEDIIEREKNANEEMESQKTSKQKGKLDAEEMRQRALERVGETKRRSKKNDDDDDDDVEEVKVKRRRRNGSDTLEFMRNKMEKDFALKQKELEERSKERELQREDQQRSLQLQNNLFQQMQIQNQAMLSLLQAVAKK